MRLPTRPETPNRPRNLLIQDATTPFTFSFRGPFDVPTSVTVHQSASDDTWPGGALWDLGVLLAQLFVALSSKEGMATVTLGAATPVTDGGKKNHRSHVQLPKRLIENASLVKRLDRPALILELGAGVGLSGLVAAAALRGRATVLTDLAVVTENVTRPIVERNTVPASSRSTPYRTMGKNKAIIVASPLCWGDAEDESRILELLRVLDRDVKPSSSPSSGVRRKKKESPVSMESDDDRVPGLPDLVIIGDVAYQHKPGAPSHFEALLSTLLRMTSPCTIVAFGTRVRMPASGDLLQLFLMHFDEIVQPPLRADEVDPIFKSTKHNMTIHLLQRKADGVHETTT